MVKHVPIFMVLYTSFPVGMPGNGYGLDLEERIPKRLRSEGDSRDIFCMVKALMSDDHLCQPPLLLA